MKYLLNIFLLFFVVAGFSQELYINGFITDYENGEKLTEVTLLDTVLNRTYISNENGYYSIPSPKGKKYILISSKGFLTHIIKDTLFSDTVINIQLRRDVNFNSIQLDINNKVKINTISGSRENLLIDKSVYHNQNHMFNLFSKINPDIINTINNLNIKLPARYEGFATQISNVLLKTGDVNNKHLKLKFSTLENTILFQGPIEEGKSSFLISARKSIHDIWLSPILNAQTDNEIDFDYGYYDINAKVYRYFSDVSKVSVNMFYVKDNFSFNDEFSNKNSSNTQAIWSNFSTEFTWNYKIRNNLLSSIRFDFLNYRTEKGNSFVVDKALISSLFTTSINNYVCHFDFDYYRENHYIKFGIDNSYQTFSSNVETLNTNISKIESSNNITHRSNLINIYAEDNYKILHLIKFNLGMRMSVYFSSNKNVYSSMQPRFSLSVKLNEDFDVNFAFSQTNSYILPVVSNSIYAPVQTFVPASTTILPQKSLQGNFGVKYEIIPDFFANLSTFYKRLNNVTEFREGVSFLNPYSNKLSFSDRIVQADGFYKGYKLQLYKNSGSLSGKIEYVFSDFTYNNEDDKVIFKNVNNGLVFNNCTPKHTFNLLLDYEFSDKLSANIVYSAHTGYNTSAPVAFISNINGKNNLIYQKNNINLSDYNRVDLELKYKYIVWNYATEFGLKVYNLLGSFNASIINPDLDSDKKNQFIQYNMVPFMPIISCIVDL